MALKEKEIDEMEKDVKRRFDAKKAEGVVIEKRISADQAKLAEIIQECARIQGEYRIIQNLRKRTEVLPAKKK